MPICKTCRGEYERRECLCPNCAQPLGRGENLCHHCGADTRGVRLCPRCHSDVSGWEREDFPLAQFMSRWGALAILPSALVLILWLAFWNPRGQTLHSPGMAIAAAAISQVVLILLYIKHLFWRERWWASQVYHTRAMPLTLAIGGTFVAGGICAVIAFFLHRVAGPPDGWPWWYKPLFGATYTLAFPWWTATLTLIAIQDYLDRLDQRVPQPLFVHTHRLLRVVVETAIKNLHVIDNGHDITDHRYEVLEVIRHPESGGLQMLLSEYRPELPAEDGAAVRWSEKIWYIQSDRWGRIQVLQPQNLVSGQEKRWDAQAYGNFS